MQPDPRGGGARWAGRPRVGDSAEGRGTEPSVPSGAGSVSRSAHRADCVPSPGGSRGLAIPLAGRPRWERGVDWQRFCRTRPPNAQKRRPGHIKRV